MGSFARQKKLALGFGPKIARTPPKQPVYSQQQSLGICRFDLCIFSCSEKTSQVGLTSKLQPRKAGVR